MHVPESNPAVGRRSENQVQTVQSGRNVSTPEPVRTSICLCDCAVFDASSRACSSLHADHKCYPAVATLCRGGVRCVAIYGSRVLYWDKGSSGRSWPWKVAAAWLKHKGVLELALVRMN